LSFSDGVIQLECTDANPPATPSNDDQARFEPFCNTSKSLNYNKLSHQMLQ
jgi:hypothetical protein